MAQVIPVAPRLSPRGSVRDSDAISSLRIDESQARTTRAPPYQQAAVVIVGLARNSAIAVAVSWCVTYFITLGDIFSRSRAEDQSLVSFTCAVAAWTTVFIGITDCALHGLSLQHGHLLSRPEDRPKLWWCVGVPLWRTLHWLTITLVACVCVTYGFFVYLPSVRKWKLYFYITVVVSHMYRTRVIQEVERIFESVTVEGQARVRMRVLKSTLSRLFLKNMSMLLSVYISIAYVQGAAQLDLRSTSALFAFAMVSLIVKLILQEATIHSAMQRKRIQVERMHAMIAIPTVLIDTQVRILLLRASQLDDTASGPPSGFSTIQLRWLGSVALAAFEIVVRVSKTIVLKAMIRKRWHERDLPRKRTLMLVSPNMVQPLGPRADSSTGSEVDESIQSCSEFQFELWKARRLALQAAEAQADMHAEYIAIGCSLSIYHFYHGHSKFTIDSRTTISSSPRLSANYVEVVVFQVVIELLVDFICTTVEIASGISFKVPRNMGAFLVSLYISCALGNIAMSSTMFLKHEEDQ